MNPPPEYAGKHAYHGPVAANYDRDRQVEKIWEREQAFVAGWAATLHSGDHVLDVPAGTGRFVEIFLERGLRVTACDISEDMLAALRRRFSAAEGPRLAVLAGDAERLPLADAAVDHVVSWRFVHLVPVDLIGRVLREFRRVARGTIVLQVFALRPSGWRTTAWDKVKDALRPWWRRLRRRPAATPWEHIASFSHAEDELFPVFAAAGLVVRDTQTLAVESDGRVNRVYFLVRTAAAGEGR